MKLMNHKRSQRRHFQAKQIKQSFIHQLNEFKLDGQALANHRFNKFRNIGTFIN